MCTTKSLIAQQHCLLSFMRRIGVQILFYFILPLIFSLMFEFLCRKLGWEPKTGESHLDAMLRGEVLTALAVFGHDLTLKEANRRFRAFLDDRNTPLLHPNIRKVGKKTIS